MKFILYIIIVLNGGAGERLERIGTYDTMDGCFTAMDEEIEKRGRPIIEYRPVCAITYGKEEEHGI